MPPIHIQLLLNEFQKSNCKIAIGEKNIEIKYGELLDKINAIVNELQKNNERRIGLYLESSIDAYASILACWFTGKSYVILSPQFPPDRINEIISLAKLNCIIAQNSISASLFNIIPKDFINLNELTTVQNEITYTLPKLEDEAYVLFTSGTTGQPKGVSINHKNLENFLDGFKQLNYELNSEDRFLQMFELTFDLSIMSFLIPLIIGASFYIIDKQKVKPLAIFETLDDKRITFALMVPSVIKTLEPYIRNEQIETLKYSQFCGEALTVSQVECWQKICPNSEIDNVYGPTEATIYCTSYRIPKNQQIDNINGIVSIGKPMFGTNLKIDNNELLIGGNQVTTGYVNISNNQSAFVEISSERFYKTGDIAELKNSIYYCMGRLDRQVKIQGFRVELSEIEHVFNTNFPECESIALLNQKNHQDQIILCIICKTNFFNIGEASETLKSKLPYYMVPSKIQRFENWPLNSNGKIDKKQLLNDIQNTES